jgi:hypothetical protein
MHNLINRRRTSRINELINALSDKVPQLYEPNPAPLPGTKDGRSKAAVLQGARLTRPARVSPGERGGEGGGGGVDYTLSPLATSALPTPPRTLFPTAPHPADVLTYVEVLQRHCRDNGFELPVMPQREYIAYDGQVGGGRGGNRRGRRGCQGG